MASTRMYTWIKSIEQPAAATAPPKRDIELGTTSRMDSTERQVLWQVDNVDETTSEKR